MTHDYKRHGTTTLFAALNVLDGTVIGRNMQRHRHQEFIRFLNTIDAEVPAGKVVHLILDNYAAHKHPKVRAWLDRHERFVFHFTPTSCSWLNAVEGYSLVPTPAADRRTIWARHTWFWGLLRFGATAFRWRRMAGVTVRDIPVRIQQIHMPRPNRNPPTGFKC